MTEVLDGAPTMLPEPEAAKLLTTYDIPYVKHGIATSPDGAVVIADRMGYPVVLKVISRDIVHKTEAGGVVLGLNDEQSLRVGFEKLLTAVAASCPDATIDGVLVGQQIAARRELIIGAMRDATFGPTVMVGLGGIFAEALSDVSFRLAPLGRQDALEMVQELSGAQILAGFRGERPVDLDEIAAILVNVGNLLSSHPEISEIDLNPVVASADGSVALDARIIVRE
jgi:acyl-CoA synthetase (NDP forming)